MPSFFSDEYDKKRRQTAVASWLALLLEPFCDFLEKRVSAHVQNGYLDFFFSFDYWLEFGH